MEQVSKEMMEELKKADNLNEILESIYYYKTDYWSLSSYIEANNYSNDAYLKIIKHINGEPQFEAEKSKKYVVRTKKSDIEGTFLYLTFRTFDGLEYSVNEYVDNFYMAEEFDTREEAEQWNNPLTEVIDVYG